MIEENLYSKSNNVMKLVIYDDDGPINFVSLGVTNITAEVNPGVFLDKDSGVEWFDDGKVWIPHYTEEELRTGLHNLTVKAFDAAHPQGQVIVESSMKRSSVKISVKNK